MSRTRPPAFDGNFVSLVREMEAAYRHLDEMPEGQKWTQDELANLDDVRTAAIRLADLAEVVIKEAENP